MIKESYYQWCIANNGGGYMQTGVAKGLKVPCLFMITEVSIRCQKNPRRLVYAVYPRIPPQYITGYYYYYYYYYYCVPLLGCRVSRVER